MNTIIDKRVYTQPKIASVKLDNDISLALESAPPDGPNEVRNSAPEYFNSDPFKSNMG
ncbi:MAG: hypothetical protein ACOYOV_16215 [Bacteroidales bacterium]